HTISKRDWSSDVCSSDLGVVVLGLTVFLVGVLGHGDETALVRLDDPDAVDGKGTADGGAGKGFGLEISVHQTVDPRLHLGRGGFLLFLLGCCHGNQAPFTHMVGVVISGDSAGSSCRICFRLSLAQSGRCSSRRMPMKSLRF